VRFAARAGLFLLLAAHLSPPAVSAQYAQPPQRGASSALPPDARMARPASKPTAPLVLATRTAPTSIPPVVVAAMSAR